MYNQNNFVEKMKFKKKNINRLIYLGVFVSWVVGYLMILKISKSYSMAYFFFAIGLSFSVLSLATAKFIPNDRESTLNFFKFGMLGYSLYIILFQILIFAVNAGGNDSPIGNTMYNIFMYSTIVVPIGLILWQAKKWMFLTGIMKNKRDAISHIKKHGNDGMN